MRILHVCHVFNPGVGFQENHLPRNQLTLGHDVQILTSDWLTQSSVDGVVRRVPTGDTAENGVPVKRLKTVALRLGSFRPGVPRIQIIMRNVVAELLAFRPDIVHAHGLFTALTIQMLDPRMRDLPLVMDDHTDGYNLRSSRLTDAILTTHKHTLTRLLRRRVAKFISVNGFSVKFLQDQLGIAPEQIALLPIGINEDVFYLDQDARRRQRARLGFSDSDVVFTSSGKLDLAKGTEELLQVFARVHQKHPSAKLLLIGRTTDASKGLEDYRKYARSLGIENAVTLHDFVPETTLNELYNASDVGVIPKKLGGIKDCLASGTPLIAPAHPATVHFVGRENGLLFPAENTAELEQAMCRYAGDAEMRAEHGRNAVNFAREELGWQRIAEQSISLYEAVVQGHG